MKAIIVNRLIKFSIKSSCLLIVCILSFGRLQAQNFILDHFHNYAKEIRKLRTDSVRIDNELETRTIYYQYDKDVLIKQTDKTYTKSNGINSIEERSFASEKDKITETRLVGFQGNGTKLQERKQNFYSSEQTGETDSIIAIIYENNLPTYINKTLYLEPTDSTEEIQQVNEDLRAGTKLVHSKTTKLKDKEGRVIREDFYTYNITDKALLPYRSKKLYYEEGSWVMGEVNTRIEDNGDRIPMDSLAYSYEKKGILEYIERYHYYNSKWNFVLREVYNANEVSPIPDEVQVFRRNGKLGTEVKYNKVASKTKHTTEPDLIINSRYNLEADSLEEESRIQTSYEDVEKNISIGRYKKDIKLGETGEWKQIVDITVWFTDKEKKPAILDVETDELAGKKTALCEIPNPYVINNTFKLPESELAGKYKLILTSVNGATVYNNEYEGAVGRIEVSLNPGVYLANVLKGNHLLCIQKVFIP